MEFKNSIIDKTQNILENIDQSIDNFLNYDIVYSVLILVFIVIITFPDILDIINTMLPKCYNISNFLPKMLFILIILYFSKKDMRISVLLTLILLLMIEKQNYRDLNNKIINLLVSDIKKDQKTPSITVKY
jgi:hypothetical protein